MWGHDMLVIQAMLTKLMVREGEVENVVSLG
jgi:hypothetical protein